MQKTKGIMNMVMILLAIFIMAGLLILPEMIRGYAENRKLAQSKVVLWRMRRSRGAIFRFCTVWIRSLKLMGRNALCMIRMSIIRVSG